MLGMWQERVLCLQDEEVWLDEEGIRLLLLAGDE
jgi:hypothetical protein